MRFYLNVDDLNPFVDNSGQSCVYQRITPILDNAHDHTRYYSTALTERILWAKEHCHRDDYCVYVCQLCNGWVVINTIVFEFKRDCDALHFRFRWLP